MKKVKINWVKLFDGVNSAWLFKDEIEMNTSRCVLAFEREKIEKILNKKINEQISKSNGNNKKRKSTYNYRIL